MGTCSESAIRRVFFCCSPYHTDTPTKPTFRQTRLIGTESEIFAIHFTPAPHAYIQLARQPTEHLASAFLDIGPSPIIISSVLGTKKRPQRNYKQQSTKQTQSQRPIFSPPSTLTYTLEDNGQENIRFIVQIAADRRFGCRQNVHSVPFLRRCIHLDVHLDDRHRF